MLWFVIYVIGVLFVGGVSAWYIKEADEDVSLLDLMKLIVVSFLSWLAVLFFALFVACLWIDEQCGKGSSRKGKRRKKYEYLVFCSCNV